MEDRSHRRLAVAALLTVLWLVAFLRALTRVFVLNFSTAGPNATGLLILTLATGWTVPVAARHLDRPAAWHATVVVALVGLGGSLAGAPLVGLAGAVVFLTAATPVLVALVGTLRERFAVAAALGVLGHGALRAVLDTAPPYATPGGQALLVALGVTTAVVWWLSTRTDGPSPSAALAAPGAATATAFLFAQVTFLGLAPRVALWTGRPLLVVLGATTLGLLGGAALVAWRGVPGRRVAAAWSFVLLGSLAALLVLPGPGVAALPAATASVALCARGCRASVGPSAGGTASASGTASAGASASGDAPSPASVTTPARTGLAVLAVQVVALALTFGVVAAMNWAFVPGVGPLARGLQAELLLVLGALLPLAVLLRERGGAGGRETTSHADLAGDRRALLAAAGVGLLGLGGAAARRATPGAAPSTDPVGVLTLNVHQWVDTRGRHNLESVRDLLAATDAGIVSLQETAGGRLTAGGLDGVGWLARELDLHAAVGPPTRLASYGVALLSRWPIRQDRVVVLPSTDTATRVALAAVVESPLGDLPVVVAHLETEGDVRVAQAERVVDLVSETGDPGRAVVLGDFNATPDERPYAVLTDAFADPWAGVGPEGDTFSASDPRKRIDYAFVGRDLSHEHGAVVGDPSVSDHRGVSATLSRPE